jgi:hypothetical protein
VDADGDQAGREPDVAKQLADPLVASSLGGHQEHANRPAGSGIQNLEVVDRVRGREGKVALQLEADHPPEVRARNRRQLHRLRDDGAPGEAHVSAPGPDAGSCELSANRGGGIVVGRHAEGGDHLPGAESGAEGDHVDPPVPEREPDHVAHGELTNPALARSRPGRPAAPS